jgi:hypothetical protein
MRRSLVAVFCFIFCFLLKGQDKPVWIESDTRSVTYSKEIFITGFAEGNINSGETAEKAVERIKTTAQNNLLESVRLNMQSHTQSSMDAVSSNNRYEETETFSNQTSKSVAAEITGMKVESYFDKTTNYIYAFAYVNKHELIGYYKSNLLMNVSQIEGLLQTANDLEVNGEKAKARRQCEAATPLFDKVRLAQDMLTAIDAKITAEDLQQKSVEQLYNTLAQMSARLAQAVLIYVENSEDLFGEKVNIIANKLKAEMAVSGCSFTEDIEKTDFKLTINAKTREGSAFNDIVFCYVDVAVELYDMHKQKTVYSDELSEKGGSSSHEKAARKAMENAVVKIINKISSWIK